MRPKHKIRIFCIVVCLFIALSITTHAQDDYLDIMEVVRAIAWNSDGTLYAVGGGTQECSHTDRTPFDILVLDASTHTVVQTLTGNRCFVTSIIWANNDTHIVASNADAKVLTWDLDGNFLGRISTGPSIATTAQSLDWQSSTNTFVASNRARIVIFDSLSPQSVTKIGTTMMTIGNVKWEPFVTGRVIAGDFDGLVQRWDVATETVLDTIVQHNSPISDLEINGQQLAVASMEGQISLIDLSDDSIINSFSVTPTYILHDVVWKPDGSQIAIAFDNIVQIYDVSTGDLIEQIDSDGQIAVVSWSPDGTQFLYGGNSPTNNLVRVPDHMLCNRCKG